MITNTQKSKVYRIWIVLFVFLMILPVSGCDNNASIESPATTLWTTSATTSQLAKTTQSTTTKQTTTTVPASPAVPFDPVAGQIIDAGNIRAVCPEGWYNLPVRDFFSDKQDALDLSALHFQKFSDDTLTNLPFVSIQYYGEDADFMPFEEQMKYYDAAEYITPFTVGDTVWEGLIYSLGDNVVEATISHQGSGVISVLVRLEGSGKAIAFTDDDLQTILTSIDY